MKRARYAEAKENSPDAVHFQIIISGTLDRANTLSMSAMSRESFFRMLSKNDFLLMYKVYQCHCTCYGFFINNSSSCLCPQTRIYLFLL